jgi:hypothetical protein
MVEEAARGVRTAGATALAGACAGGIEKNHVARMPAPEITAVDFQSMLEKTTAILTFRSRQPLAIAPGWHSLFAVLRSLFVFTFGVRAAITGSNAETEHEPSTENTEG